MMAPSRNSMDKNRVKYSFHLNTPDAYPSRSNLTLNRLLKTSKTTLFQVFKIFISAILYVFDIGSDLYLAYSFHLEGHSVYFFFTLLCVFLPGIIIAILYHEMYLKNPNSVMYVKSKRKKLGWLMLTLLQLELLRMYVLAMFYGIASIVTRWKSKKDKNMESTAVNFDKDTLDMEEALVSLRLIEAFMEGAPQVMLQLYIVFTKGPENIEILQLCSILTSLIGLAFSVTAYYKFKIQPATISITGYGFLCFGYFCTISARVLILSGYGHMFPLPVIGICALHWLIMMSWFITDTSTPYETTLEKMCFAWIYLFVFINDTDQDSNPWKKWKYPLAYFLSVGEIFILLTIWFYGLSIEAKYKTKDESRKDWDEVFPLILGTSTLYIFGVVFVSIITGSCFVRKIKSFDTNTL